MGPFKYSGDLLRRLATIGVPIAAEVLQPIHDVGILRRKRYVHRGRRRATPTLPVTAFGDANTTATSVAGAVTADGAVSIPAPAVNVGCISTSARRTPPVAVGYGAVNATTASAAEGAKLQSCDSTNQTDQRLDVGGAENVPSSLIPSSPKASISWHLSDRSVEIVLSSFGAVTAAGADDIPALSTPEASVTEAASWPTGPATAADADDIPAPATQAASITEAVSTGAATAAGANDISAPSTAATSVTEVVSSEAASAVGAYDIPAASDDWSDIFKVRKGHGFVHINIRSLLPKMDFLKIWVTEHDPDVVVISETWLNPSVKDLDIALPGYNVYRVDRLKRGGGVAIYAKSNFITAVCSAISVPGQFELLALCITLGGSSLTIAGVYRPPSAAPEALINLYKYFSSWSKSDVVILGDFNLDWLSSATDDLQSMCLDLNLTQMITTPTRPNMKVPSHSSLLDLILTNRPHLFSSSGVFPLDLSDHCPIGCIRNGKKKATGSIFVHKRALKKVNSEAFLCDLYENGINSVELIYDAEQALDHFISVFNCVSDIHAPYKKLRVKNRSNPWFSHEVSSLLHKRNAAWKLARSSGTTANWQSFRQLRNKCTNVIRRAKSSFYVNSFTACGNNSSKFWKIFNSINGPSPSSSTLPKQIDIGSKVLIDPIEICGAFNNHFIKSGDLFDQYNAKAPTMGGANSHMADNLPRPKNQFFFTPVFWQDVFTALCSSKCMKSTVGADNLDPYLLKLAAPVIARPLAHIFNLCLFSGNMPVLWKSAFVVPLYKGGGQGDLNNYRPISKLPCLAKLLESFVNEQVTSFLSLNAILCPYQSGFRAGHSTTTAATVVVNDLATAIDNKLSCAALFIDLSKAFDTVNHDILLAKLASLGFDNISLKWFNSYLHGRTQCLNVSGITSAVLETKNSVPQGSILGPTLFSLYINDIWSPSEECKAHFYADDTILYAFGTSVDEAVCKLQLAFDNVQKSLFDLKRV